MDFNCIRFGDDEDDFIFGRSVPWQTDRSSERPFDASLAGIAVEWQSGKLIQFPSSISRPLIGMLVRSRTEPLWQAKEGT